MYLKELTLNNFRKFPDKDNTISFVHGHEIYEEEFEEKNINDYNFAENITLIVGKNNSGKTTVIKALEKIRNIEKIYASDFNFKYLDNIFENLKYRKDYESDNSFDIFPEISFSLKIGFDHNEKDLLSNIYPILEINDLKNEKNEIIFDMKWSIKEENIFLEKFNNQSYSDFSDFCELIDETVFVMKYYRSGKEIKNFNIKKFLNVQIINATKIREDKNNLSKAFNKILNYRYKYILDNGIDKDLTGELEKSEEDFVNELNKDITEFNEKLSKELENHVNSSLNEALEKVVSDDIFKIILSSDLNIDKILRNIIRYAYSEDNYETVEENFGLGYSNLVMIIAEIIDYLSQYQKSGDPESTINLIVIEEPEVHMHPQMQENFLLNVEKMINSLLINLSKNISTQVIITTHSPHMVNSKLHSGNSFDNINYINSNNNSAKAITLKDGLILKNYSEYEIPNDDSSEAEEISDEKKPQQQLTFLKKHMKFQISEIFFSDAVIFVEGATEYTLLPYYLEKNHELNRKYITLAMVDGAHAHMYFPLLELLEIPSLIITDLDIKRESDEKGEDNSEYKQMEESFIKNRETTNNVLKKVCNKNIEDIVGKNLIMVEDNIAIATQNCFIQDYLPTSFEEAYILENYDNNSLIKALQETKPNLSKSWIDNERIITDKSFEIQMKLDGSKVEFPSNILLFSSQHEGLKLPKLPTYINNGFNWLSNNLKGEYDAGEIN